VVVANPPVIAPSLHLFVTPPGGDAEEWERVDDLLSAGPEVPGPDWRLSPGTTQKDAPHANVFTLDAEAGKILFGDGARGARPPAGAKIRVNYDSAAGRAGNVGENAINQAPALPAGLQVTNPVRTWGGADSESLAEGEKQISRYLQHRDRLVTVADFETIARRTPGVDVGRVEVLPAFNPGLTSQEPGNAPGAVTLMLIPKYSATRPDAPSPHPTFLSAVCAWLDPRRLVTTELFLEGPKYVPIWISIAIEIVAVQSETDAPNSTALVREAVKQRLQAFLSPVRADGTGWPLRRPVLRLELVAEASRVSGVALVNELLLAARDAGAAESIPMTGLELPRLDGIEVTVDPEPLALDQLRGVPNGGTAPPNRKRIVPVPTIPAEC
jgi:predicted phage baseplate assembly protein